MTYRMPAEWEPHERTWMAWPGPNATFADDEKLAEARTAWAAVARAVRRFEPVTMVHGTGQGSPRASCSDRTSTWWSANSTTRGCVTSGPRS